MIVLRLTNKVLKEFGRSKLQLSSVPVDVPTADEWYVNLFYLNRRKCLLFTNVRSLFSFVAEGISRKEIQNLLELFRKELSRALFYEEFSSDQIKQFMNRTQEIMIAKTSSRSVLASMNQIAFVYPYIAESFAHMGKEGVIAANRELNQRPHRPIGQNGYDYGFPIECFTEMVTGKKVERVAAPKQALKIQTAYIFEAKMTHYAESENIMRQVAVLGNKSLLHLAQVILNAFDFDCDHCFGFYGDIYKHPGRAQTEIYEAFVDADVEPTNDLAKSVERTKISTVFKDVGKKMLFMFDYGEDWRFIVELKEIQEKSSIEKLPKVLNSIGAAPPQYPQYPD